MPCRESRLEAEVWADVIYPPINEFRAMQRGSHNVGAHGRRKSPVHPIGYKLSDELGTKRPGTAARIDGYRNERSIGTVK